MKKYFFIIAIMVVFTLCLSVIQNVSSDQFGYFGPSESVSATIEDSLKGSEFTPTSSGTAVYIKADIDVSVLPGANNFNHGNYDSFTHNLDGNIEDWVRGQRFTLTGTGNYYVEYVAAYLYITDSAARTMKAAIYNVSSGDLIATSVNKTVYTSTVWDWEEFYFEDTPILTPGDYVYAVWSDNATSGYAWLWGNSTTSHSDGRIFEKTFDGVFPDLSAYGTYGRDYRIYAKLHNFSREPKVKTAIYNGTSNSLVGYSEEKTVVLSGWTRFDIATPATRIEAGQPYILVAWSDAGSGNVRLRNTSGDYWDQGHWFDQTYGIWPAGPISFNVYDRKYGIFCYYESDIVRNINTEEDFTSIQAAIDDSDTLDGHTITVGSGVYEESITITKSLTIIGEDKENTIINGTESSAPSVYISSGADYVNLSRFTILHPSSASSHYNLQIRGNHASIDNCTIIANNSGTGGLYGVYIDRSNNNTINNSILKSLTDHYIFYSENSENITISNCYIEMDPYYPWRGIRFDKVGVYKTDNNLFTNNTIKNSDLRISLNKNFTIFNNTFLNNATIDIHDADYLNFSNNKIEAYSVDKAIYLGSVDKIIMRNNYINNTGLRLYESYKNTIENNYVNMRHLVYLEDYVDYNVDLAEYAGQVLLNNCSKITVENQNLSDTITGVWVNNTNESKINNNIIKNNVNGIYSEYSHNNTFENNTIESYDYGFHFRTRVDNNSIKNNSINSSFLGIFSNDLFYNNSIEYNDIKGSRDESTGLGLSYNIFYKKDDYWNEIQTLHLNKIYDYYIIDVSDLLTYDVDEYVFRIKQKGGIAAHIDYIALYNGEYISPKDAFNIESKENIYSKIVKKDNDVVNAHNQYLEFRWINEYDKTPRFIILNANEELYETKRPITTPMTMETHNMMDYTISNNGIITIKDIDYNIEPDFSDIWHPGSGHPTGKVNLWLGSNGINLYGILDVTSDNTYDETGWGSLYISKYGDIQEFRITSEDKRFGESHFIYTDSASWQHMVYEFCIPLEEISSEIGDNIRIGFGSYGTMSGYEAGIHIPFGNKTTIKFNNISYSYSGIILGSSHEEKIIHNKIFNNTNYGIDLYSENGRGSNKNISSNHIYNNTKGVVLQYNLEYNTIKDNNISNNTNSGIDIVHGSNNNTIINNIISGNGEGGIILFEEAENNTFHSNIIKQNVAYGLLILSSNNNTFYNNYFENFENALDNYNNIWNIIKAPGKNIVNGPYIGGNYWSDYTGEDNDGDGLGDTLTPHNSSDLIKYGGDYHPLIISTTSVVKNIDTGEVFVNIQDAIDDSDTVDGHTIIVSSGIYEESIYIHKSISLVGASKDNTTINGTSSFDTVFIFADYVNFSGFTVQNTSSFSYAGAYVYGNFSNIENCTFIVKSNIGVHMEYGSNNTVNNSIFKALSGTYCIDIDESNNNTISNCTIESNSIYNYRYGIHIHGTSSAGADNNTIINNTFDNVRVYLSWSDNDVVLNNTFLKNATFRVHASNYLNFSNNTYNSYSIYNFAGIGSSNNITMMNNDFTNSGLRLSNTQDNLIIDNIINERDLIYLEDVTNEKISSAGQVLLNNCYNITVENQNLSDCVRGVWLVDTNYCNISNNSIKNTFNGIYNTRSDNNTFSNNTIESIEYGVWIDNSDNNSIKNNSINSLYDGIFLDYDCYGNIIEYNDITGRFYDPSSAPTSYYIYYKNGDNWKEIKTLHLTKIYEYFMIDLSDLVLNNDDEYIFRVEQKGGITAHIDYISLFNGDYQIPDKAYNLGNEVDVLSKIVENDNDVVNAHNQVFEFIWKNDFEVTPRFLILNANEELYEVEHPLTTPMIMDPQNMMKYTIKNNGIISIENIDYYYKPDFSDTWHPGSGHPVGKTNLWFSSDGNDLFGILDITCDNTFDETGWGSLYICVKGDIQEFRITSKDDKFGESHFIYTDSVSWQHMVYEFSISLKDINSKIGDTVNIGFGSYGTASGQEAGIFSGNANNTIIRFNNISYANDGIIIWDSHPEKIFNNNIFNNSMSGIKLSYDEEGEPEKYSNYKNISSNHIFNNSVGIYLEESDLNTICDNNIYNNTVHGIYIFDDSNDNIIYNNTLSNNSNSGISFDHASFNTFHSNIVKHNNNFGIQLLYSHNNTIYNNYFNNIFNAYDTKNNTWNISKKLKTNIVNGPYQGGNYWNDYTGIDNVDDDGLGDTLLPYNSNGDIIYDGDYHPLIIQDITPCTDLIVDDDGGQDYTTIQDAVDAACPGVTIYVYNGTYNENLLIEKSISVIGNSSSECIVKSVTPDIPVFTIRNIDNVNLSGFTVRDVNGANTTGILVDNVIYSDFIDIVITNITSNDMTYGNAYGLFLNNSNNVSFTEGNIYNISSLSSLFSYGICINNSNYNNISYNKFNNTEIGLYLSYSNKNIILNNHFNNSDAFGFFVWYSDDNQIGHNTILESWYGNFGSCPILYTWDGSDMRLFGDINGPGGLGYRFDKSIYNEGIVNRAPTSTDYTAIDSSLLSPKDGSYIIEIAEDQDEITYLDYAELWVIDHDFGVEIYSPEAALATCTPYLHPFVLHTVRNPFPPVSAVDRNGEDIKSIIAFADEVYTEAELLTDNVITLDLGDLSDAEQIKLVYRAYTDWSPIGELKANQYVEVINEFGEWEMVSDDEHFGLPEAMPRTYVIDITNWFKTDDWRIKLHTGEVKVHVDWINIDTSLDEEVDITILKPSSAEHYYKGIQNRNFEYFFGNFTRYGEVLSLLTEVDDKYVIMRTGDSVILNFDEQPDSLKDRDFLLFTDAFFKQPFVKYKLGEKRSTVDPLPFHNMSNYPYTPDESYNFDIEHILYLMDYNTRVYDGNPIEAGMSLPYSDNNTVYENIIIGGLSSTGLLLETETNTKIINNTIIDSLQGMHIHNSDNITVEGNKIYNHSLSGLYLWSSSNCTIKSNKIINNTDYGLYLLNSDNNTIYNNYLDNDINAWDNNLNTWNITKTLGTNIVNGPYLGGNYWSDYTGSDEDSDGLGNTDLPHNSSNNITYGGDYHPLINFIVNNPPIATPDSATTEENTAIWIDILANDYDIDGTLNNASVLITSGPAHGTLTQNHTTGAIQYTPTTDYYGSDSFNYTVDDNDDATSNIAEVTITVNHINNPPIATPDSATTEENTAIWIDILANDYDIDGTLNNASVLITSGPAHGTLTQNHTTGAIQYTPTTDYYGSDSFNYTVDDNDDATSNIAEVTIAVYSSSYNLEDEIENLDDYIQNLPDNNFTKKPEKRKRAISNMLTRASELFQEGNYSRAIRQLEAIKGKADGFLDGKKLKKNDWIIDTVAQAYICGKIDDMIDYIEEFI